MKRLLLIGLILSSCETIAQWDLFPKPAEPLNYRDVLDLDHPLRMMLDSFYPTVRTQVLTYDPNIAVSVPGPNGSLVNIPQGSLEVPKGTKVTVAITQASSSLEILSSGQTLWTSDRTVFETGGMIRLTVTDPQGRPVATKAGSGGLALTFPESDSRPGFGVYQMTSRGWDLLGSQSTFLDPDTKKTSDQLMAPGFYQVQPKGNLTPAPILRFSLLRPLFDQINPGQDTGDLIVNNLYYRRGQIQKNLTGAAGEYRFFRYPGRQTRGLVWSVQVTNPFKPTAAEQKVIDEKNKELARLNLEMQKKAQEENFLMRKGRILQSLDTALPPDTWPWWNCDIESRNTVIVQVPTLQEKLGITKKVVMMFVFIDEDLTVWDQDQQKRIPLSTSKPMTLVYTTPDKRVFVQPGVTARGNKSSWSVQAPSPGRELTSEELKDPGLFSQALNVQKQSLYILRN